jgi:hypothetical protein
VDGLYAIIVQAASALTDSSTKKARFTLCPPARTLVDHLLPAWPFSIIFIYRDDTQPYMFSTHSEPRQLNICGLVPCRIHGQFI